MRNLTTLAVEAFAGTDGWRAIATDAENSNTVYGAKYTKGTESSLLRLSFARVTLSSSEELTSLAVVASPIAQSLSNEVLLFELLSDGGEAVENAPALCTVTAGGDILLLPVDAGSVEIVGSVEQGLLAAQWSPDEDLLVLITSPSSESNSKLLVMTRDFAVLHEASLISDEFGDDAPVNVGWGSKSTQFHGSEGKQAAAAAANALSGDTRGPLVEEDDLLPHVAWRADGAYFIVSTVESDNYGTHRVLRTFTRDGALSATSDPTVRGLSHCLAVRPVGNVIATTQRAGIAPDGREWAPGRSGRHDVVFFERNGLRHNEFSLREEHGAVPKGDVGSLPEWNTHHTIQSLSWNADGNILAVHLIRNDQKHALQLWTTRNYHWYLKQEMVWDDLFTSRWHPEDPFKLYILRSHTLEQRTYRIETHVSSGAPPHDAASVAVIDGSAILLTPFRLQNVPPPMCAKRIVDTPAHTATSTPVTPMHLAWDTLADGDATTDYLAVLYPGMVHVWRIAYGKLGKRQPWDIQRVATYEVSNDAYQVAVAVDAPTKIRIAALTPTELHSENTTQALESGPKVLRLASKSKTFVLEHPNGQIDIKDNQFRLSAFCADIVVLEHSATPTVLGLASNGQLLTPERCLAKNVTSFAVTDRLVVWTTWTHEARFLPLAALAEDAHTIELGRRVERGSTIVAAIPSAMALVLQMPRGNLETICPRPMVLDVIRDLIDQHQYGEAFIISRAHRVDLNLLYDHAPNMFLEDVPKIVAQIDNVDHLNLLISSMRNEDVTRSLYRPLLATDHHSADPKNKVNAICDAFLLALEIDQRRFLNTILTAHIRKTPPDFENGLRVLLRYKDQDLALAEEACKYIIFLANVEQLFRVALGMYDFQLALLIAQHSQKDPREYVAFLRDLRSKQPEPYQRFCVDDHLGKHTRALHHLSHVGERFDQLLSYTVEHKLYREALDAFNKDFEKQRKIYDLFGDYLLDHQRASEAASAYLLANDSQKAIDAFREADLWQEALTTACAQHWPANNIRTLAQTLVEQLTARGQYEGAAQICFDYLQDAEAGVSWLCSAQAFPSAMRRSALNQRMDLVKTHIEPAALDAQVSTLEEVDAWEEQLTSQLKRLAELDSKRDEAPTQYFPEDGPGLENIDMQSDTFSQLTQFTRYTAAPSVAESMSTLSLGTRATASRSRAKQKKEQKKKLTGKKGSIYEETYLLESLQNLLAKRLGALQRNVGDLLPTLLTLGPTHRNAANVLQQRLLALEEHARQAADTLGERAQTLQDRKQQVEHELVAAVSNLAHAPGEESASQALAALYAMRHTSRIPATSRPEVASERWKLHLLDKPQSP
ncbi:Putative elongator complex protein 1 [Malassezia psittaci]|uniref:Elongator complex protein 1 n=1 Tax=Malassezia psittaci TaxID=1821823 RepID=A0AAF0F5Y5_9BASI|nr:Putative elongator complex protein 1 [Malassezia psittaci]